VGVGHGAGAGRFRPSIEIGPLRVGLRQRFGVECILRTELQGACAVTVTITIAAAGASGAEGRRPLGREDRAVCREVCRLVVVDLATHAVVGSAWRRLEVEVLQLRLV
jgi:hypothetical protein